MSVPVVFSTGSLYPFGLERIFGLAASAGYDGVEVMMDDHWDTHQEDYLNFLVARHGIPIRALHPPLGRGAWELDPEATLVRVAGLAGKVGADVIVAHPPPAGRPLDRWSRTTLARARAQGVDVAVENMSRNRVRRLFLRRDAQYCYLPERLTNLGDLTLDTSHLAASGVDLMHAWEVLEDQLRHIHLSDSNMTGRDEHLVPGRGKLPLKELLAALGESEYCDAVCLELKPRPLGVPDSGTVLDRMREALEFTREGLRKG